VEFDDVDATGALMESVDVLRDDSHRLRASSTLEFGDGDVSGVRLRFRELRPASAVEAPDFGKTVW